MFESYLSVTNMATRGKSDHFLLKIDIANLAVNDRVASAEDAERVHDVAGRNR